VKQATLFSRLAAILLFLNYIIGGIASAAPIPTVTTSGIPAEHFVGEQFCFTASLTSGPDTGYGPYLQLFLKPDYDLASATLFGSSVTSTLVGTFPSVTTDPITGEPVSGPAGSNFYTLQLPIGTVTNGGAPINTNICIDVYNNATPDVLQTDAVQLTPVFQFGDSPTGRTPITGSTVSEDNTPTIINYRQVDETAESENPPGPLFTYDIDLIADIASDRTVSPIVFPQVDLTNNRQFVGPIENTGGTDCVATVTNSAGQVQSGPLPFMPSHMTTPGGFIDVTCTSGTGTLGNDGDIEIDIPVYATDILDPQSCSFEDNSNRNISKHVVIRKSASSPSIVPGDVLTFILSFEVSEYTSVENMSITDVMPDGLTYNGIQSMVVGGNSYTLTPVVSNNIPSGGQTTVQYDLSAAYGATFNSATTGVITYTATVDEFYNNGEPLRSNDQITNSVDINYDVVGGASNCYDNSAATLRVIPMTIEKTLLTAASEYQPGESVDFRLRLNIPSGDTTNIVFNDYFPLPVLTSNGIDTTLNLATNTHISHGPNDTLGFNPLSITVDPVSNGLSIVWPDVTSNKAEVIEIDVKAQVISTDPFEDNLFLTNVFEMVSESTLGAVSRLYDGVYFVVRSPVLEIEKNITSPSAGLDAGDTVTYTIDVTNVGGATAFDTVVRDDLPSDVTGCTVSSQPAGSGDLFSLGGYALSNSLAPTDSISFSFSCTLSSSIQINSVHRNTAYVSWASAVGAPKFPEISDNADFSTSPKATTKRIISTSQAHTTEAAADTLSDPRLVSIGETIRYQLVVTLPEGTSNSATIYDQLPNGLQYIPDSATVALVSDTGISHAITCTGGGSPLITGSVVATPTCAINPTAATFNSGTDPNFNLGNLLNTDNDDNSEYIVIEFDAMMIDNIVNQQTRKVSNRFRPRFNGNYFAFSNRVYNQVIEPQLSLTANTTPLNLNTVSMTMNLSNTGLATAFQVAGNDGAPWSITLQNGLKNISNINVTSIGNVYENGTATPLAAADFQVSGVNNDVLSLTKALQLDPNAEFTLSFDAEIIPGATPGNTLADIVFEYASQATGGPANHVRDGSDSNSGDGNTPINDNSVLDDYRVEVPLNVYAVSGKVYEDINTNSTFDTGENGIYDVTIVLYDPSTGSCRSTKTNSEGEYAFFPVSPGNYQVIESALEKVTTPAQCPPTAQDPSGYRSTTDNTLNVSVVDSSIDNQDFGDVSGPTFEPSHNDSILPGNVTFYAHTFRTPASGTVAFTTSASGQQATGWSHVTYRDSNCDGELNGAEANTPIASINFGVSADSEFCIINKVYAPANAPANDRYTIATTANFTYQGGDTQPLVVNDVTMVTGDVSPTTPATTSTQVTPAVGASQLELRKTVENTTQNTGETATANQAKPGDFLTYRIYYRNTGTGPITDLVVKDSVPAFTSFVLGTESCDSTPPGMSCTPNVVFDNLHWGFTGKLGAGASGSVSYEVMVSD